MILKSLMIKIDRASRIPIKDQIVEEIKNLINQGLIKTDTALPSSRVLAVKLGVSRYTVYQAYEELQVYGHLKSRPGSYNVVQKRKKEAPFDPERKSIISWEKVCNESSERLFAGYLKNLADIPTRSQQKDPTVINLTEMQLDPSLFPVENFSRCLRHILSENGQTAMDFCSPEGNEALRDYIAQRLGLHGISTSQDEILITYGSQQALDLIMRLLCRSDKKVVIESPTYYNIIPLLQFYNSSILGIPMRHDGMDLGQLERVLNEEAVSFVYTIPNFQNPTGLTTSHNHREKLLNICIKHRVPIVEDGFDEEMKYSGILPLPIKSIDEKNIVLYLGTFSKILFPGLRIGWVTADKDCIRRLTALKRTSDLRCGNLTQTALAYFCQQGYYDLHLRRLHRIFRNRLEVALQTMKDHFPKTTSWTRPKGGYSIWVRMPKKMSPIQLHEHMSRYKVGVSPGGYYFLQQSESEYFRLSIARVGAEEIREGIKRLACALRELSLETDLPSSS
ncbi:MAG: PLP-dependent aminotransferase family protein [Candidatus Aminicenantes bacterium]|nr:PLP-dependent aminotransferase family protein [Candidatus Aminicenantes bacterium]